MRIRPFVFLFECACFVAGPVSAQLRTAYLNVPPSGVNDTLRIEDFVRREFPKGVPFREARRYAVQGSSSTLLEMLGRSSEREHWENIVVTLGIIGDPDAISPLAAFLQGTPSSQPEDDSSFAARSNVLIAFGCAVNQMSNRHATSPDEVANLKKARAEALGYLVGGRQPSFWVNRIKWSSPYHGTPLERNLHLSNLAIQALALTGDREALSALQSLRDNLKHYRSPANSVPANCRWIQRLAPEMIDELSGATEEALGIYSKVAASGLAEYYTH
jgi:hypothetical protein